MAKFNLQKGDTFIARPACPRDENTGEILFVPKEFDKPLRVTKVFQHGVSSNRGYIHNNCIISKSNGMKTRIITKHKNDPIDILWDIETNELVTNNGYDTIAYNQQEAIELRDFLNQLELDK